MTEMILTNEVTSLVQKMTRLCAYIMDTIAVTNFFSEEKTSGSSKRSNYKQNCIDQNGLSPVSAQKNTDNPIEKSTILVRWILF